jgi:hypothetical protein
VTHAAPGNWLTVDSSGARRQFVRAGDRCQYQQPEARAGSFPSEALCNSQVNIRQEQNMERERRKDIATPQKPSIEGLEAFEAAFMANFFSCRW